MKTFLVVLAAVFVVSYLGAGALARRGELVKVQTARVSELERAAGLR